MGNSPSSYSAPSLKAKLGAINYFNRERTSSYIQACDIPELHLTKWQKKLLRKHFHQTILANKPDLFLDAMVLSLENSVSMRRVIFPNGLPDGRDLHLYPRLIGISRAQERFYDSLIFVNNLDPWAMGSAIYLMGVQHYTYFRNGFSPTFFDIWGTHMYGIASDIEFPENVAFLEAFQELNAFIGNTMTLSLRRCKEDEKRTVFPRPRAHSTSTVTVSTHRSQDIRSSNFLLPPIHPIPRSSSHLDTFPHSAGQFQHTGSPSRLQRI